MYTILWQNLTRNCKCSLNWYSTFIEDKLEHWTNLFESLYKAIIYNFCYPSPFYHQFLKAIYVHWYFPFMYLVLRVTDIHKLLCGCWGSNTGLLKEHSTLNYWAITPGHNVQFFKLQDTKYVSFRKPSQEFK